MANQLHPDVISVVASFLSFQDMMIMEIICKEWKIGLYKHCASVKSFQLTKKLLYLVQGPTPRPDITPYQNEKENWLFNNHSFIRPKDQNHRLIVRKMVSKWFGEMFPHVERLHFSDVRFSKELVEDFFSNKDFCSNVKQLVFVGCYLLTHCVKEFVKKMKNVECIIYYQNNLGEVDLKNLEQLVNIPTLRYLYYPQADLVNLSKLTSKDQYSPFYFELEDGYSADDSEDSEDHQVIIFDIEKTKQFQKSKGNLEETLKMFGIISNEFKELYLKAIESPTNECLSQLNKLIKNGMHFFDVNFEDCYVGEIILNHWRHLNSFPFLISSPSFRVHSSNRTCKLLNQGTSTEERFEMVKTMWPILYRRGQLQILSECNKLNILKQLIVERVIEIDLDNYIKVYDVWLIKEEIIRFQTKRKANTTPSPNKKSKKK